MAEMWLLLALMFALILACLWLWSILAGDRDGAMVDEEPTMNTRGKD